ncbi:MAG TPA: hypothetical protein VIC08_13765 [Cellvibrionaceae bacterium]
MTLAELLAHHSLRPQESVPEWMLGCFRRRAISFANGQSDVTTLVYWIQSRNFTLDLRLPHTSEQPPLRNWQAYSAQELQILANYEGWQADSVCTGNALSWQGGCSLQLHNRWPEPASLYRIGNCMMEFAPSGAYVEDWRLQVSSPGPLIGLRLLQERNLHTGECQHKGGGLIICGDYAALVLGRPEVIEYDRLTLPKCVAAAQQDPALLARYFAFETSVARGSLVGGFTVEHSTCPGRSGEQLFETSGFEWLPDTQQLRHTYSKNGHEYERLFSIDTFEAEVDFSLTTPIDTGAQDWFTREALTLTRYTEVLE